MSVDGVNRAASYFAQMAPQASGAWRGTSPDKPQAGAAAPPPADTGQAEKQRQVRLAQLDDIKAQVAKEAEDKIGKHSLTPEEEEKLRKTIASEATRRFRNMLEDHAAASADGSAADGASQTALVVDMKV